MNTNGKFFGRATTTISSVLSVAFLVSLTANINSCSSKDEVRPYGYHSLPIQLGERLGPDKRDPKTFEEAKDFDFGNLVGYDNAERTVKGVNYMGPAYNYLWLDTTTYKFDEDDNLIIKRKAAYDRKGGPISFEEFKYEYLENGHLVKTTQISGDSQWPDGLLENVDTSFHKLNYYGYGTDGAINWIYSGYVKTNTSGDTLSEFNIERDNDGKVTSEELQADNGWTSTKLNIYSDHFEDAERVLLYGTALSIYFEGMPEKNSIDKITASSWNSETWNFENYFQIDSTYNHLILK